MRDKDKAGFLLFEVMVSVAILALGLVFVLRTFTASLNAVKTAENYTRALLLLEEKMWEQETLSVQMGRVIPQKWNGGFAGEEGFAWDLKTAKMEHIPLDEANLAVSWRQGKRQGRVSLWTYLRSEDSQ